MHPLMQLLATRAHVIAPDWPGFGDQPRPPVAWTPDALSSFLAQFVREEVPALHGTIAAGHAASYALHLAAQKPGILGRLVLDAPTWRGPLPTMAADTGQYLARPTHDLTASHRPLALSLERKPAGCPHDDRRTRYRDPHTLSNEQRGDKQRVIKACGARFGSAAFVTGGLDRVHSREALLDVASRVGRAIFVAYSAGTPPKSRAKMDALADLPMVQSFVVLCGKLGIHEESPEAICPVIEEFLFQDRY